jgi:predicted RNA-binding Zn-ribbon protein involved in translation (DUF1610 family)
MANLLRDGIAKTRKEHKCHGCLETIPKGAEVYYQACADGGRAYSIYMCEECRKWCEDKKCRDCLDMEEAYEGYVKECKRYAKD